MRIFTHDAYSPLDYKFTGDRIERRPGVRTWVPEEHQRRITAYEILASYASNISRNFLPPGLTDEQIRMLREYGHPDRIIQGAVSAVLGNEQTIHVAGAKPVEVAANEDGTSGPQPPEVVRAQAALDYLEQWALSEKLWLELAEAELDAAKLGDMVLTLVWDEDKKRPRIVAYDPGLYFPVANSRAGSDFNQRLHFAWEEKGPDGKPRLHRLTYSLDPIRPAQDPDSGVGALSYLYTEDGRPVPQDGDRLDSDGQLIRFYPWNTRDGQPVPSRVACHQTEAIYDLEKVRGSLFALDFFDGTRSGRRDRPGRSGSSGVRYVTRELDLGIDFIPVIHEPNTPSRREGFGRSVLTMVLQLIDDIHTNDTDLSESAALVGNATLVTKNGPAGDVESGPGRRIDLPVDGEAEYLDTSKNLVALMSRSKDLHSTLSINTRLTDAFLGRTDASNAVSGLALALSFSPVSEYVRMARLVRDEKFPLLLKFVLRFAQLNGDLEPGPTPDATILLGSFLPADLQEAIKVVTEAVKAGVMSPETGVTYLQEKGIPYDDIPTELKRLRGRDIQRALQLVEATGNVDDAYAYLGIEPAAGRTQVDPEEDPEE